MRMHRRLPVLAMLLQASLSAAAAPAVLPADPQRLSDLRSALARAPTASSAEFGELRRQLGHDALWPWIEQRRLLSRDVLPVAELERFLKAHADQAVAVSTRRAALHALAKRKDWPGFRRIGATPEDLGDGELRCHALVARLAEGNDPGVIDEALREWLRGHSLPAACDPVIATLQRTGRLDTSRTLQRIEAAAGLGQAGLMRFLARSLEASLRARIEAEADFIESPDARTLPTGSASPRTRAAVESGLSALARRDPDAAEALLEQLESPLSLERDRVSRLRHAIALWSAANYLPNSAARFERVPAEAFDTRLHEWRAREALARQDVEAALTSIGAMPETLRESARWRLIEARLLAARGAHASARARLQAAATEANFHGFLAADALDQDYPLCPLSAATGQRAEQRLKRAGVERALDLYALGRPGWAHREWDHAMARLAPADQALAVEAASHRGWHERAAHTLGNGEGMRFYAQRFPLPHRSLLERESSRHALPHAWVAGLIRAESSWRHDARSHADARGLMQLLPSTARDTSRRLGRSFAGARALYQPHTNIELGTAYLRQLLDSQDGRPALATAAYNAGPAAVTRWLRERPARGPVLGDPVLWLETMPFHETREYVARVAAFSLLYEWRMQGRAGSLLALLQGTDRGRPRAFRCPTP